MIMFPRPRGPPCSINILPCRRYITGVATLHRMPPGCHLGPPSWDDPDCHKIPLPMSVQLARNGRSGWMESVFTFPGIRVQVPRNRCSRSPESMFRIPGIGVHHALEWMFTMDWNRCSGSPGIRIYRPRLPNALTSGEIGVTEMDNST